MDVSGITERSTFESAILSALRAKASEVTTAMGPKLASMSLRLTICGATSLAVEASKLLANIEEDLEVTVGDPRRLGGSIDRTWQ